MTEKDDVYEDDAALLAAITGESAPDTPELRAAREDIDVLRAQLALIADELDPQVIPVTRNRDTRNRRLRIALAGVAAVGVLGLLGTGAALLSGRTVPGDAGSAADKSVTSAEGSTASESPACGTTVVEGTVTAVHGSEVTLRVTHAYSPRPGPATLTFVTDTALTPGTRVLVQLAPGSSTPDDLLVGSGEIAARRPALDRASGESGTCPP
ncbi:hypothetical protein [Streptomyces sp. 4F14]|uniref:hypothetical protein n=1 Tax=Streptomyces sp. 4F14 TaxID=3394380 RepID=UPI003A87C0D0